MTFEQLQRQVEDLKQQVASLMAASRAKELQPFNEVDRDNINRDLPVFKRYDTSTTTNDGKITVEINGQDYYINVNKV